MLQFKRTAFNVGWSAHGRLMGGNGFQFMGTSTIVIPDEEEDWLSRYIEL